MDYIYGKLNFEIKKVEYKGTATETATTTVVTSDEANEVSVDVLKVPNTLTAIDKFDETITTFDGSSNKTITIHSYSMLKTLVPAEENQAEYSLTKDGEPIGDKIIFSKTVLNVSWTDLKTLRDSSQLVPGRQYRITDYECTTVQSNTQSAGHQFDIIVTADDVDKLNENARACLHEGDTYFANSKLEAWKLMYCLDNDANRFAWADEVDGKGVIYRMIDEFNNDCPYDFKNIQFKRKLTDGELDLDSGIDTWVYTFTMSDLIEDKLVDISLKQNTEYSDDEGQYAQCSSNVIKEAILDSQPDGLIRIQLNDNVFLNIFDYSGDNVYYGCYSNIFGEYCYSNTFGNGCSYNIFGNDCKSNTFGNGCYYNIFGNGCVYLQISNTSNTVKKYIYVDSGIKGASSANKFDLYDPAILNKNYQVTFKKSASGKYLMLWATDAGTMTGKIKDNNTDTTWEDIV